MTKSEEVYQKITGYANYSQMNGISKSWIIKCIDNALNEQLTLTDVSCMFSAEKVEDAYSDGLDYGMGNGGLKFHLENYR
jgi:hypothetical protein